MHTLKLISSFKARSYQESLFAQSLDKNTLVVLPTGLGKTIVALMLSVYYFNKTNKKILFLAPTKPLVEQQKKSFEELIENSDEINFSVLTGQVSPKKRAAIYEESDIIFSTPQLVENDIVNRVVNPRDFGFLIIDEAHRGTGNYAYCFIAEQLAKQGVKILALTASPGTSKEQITGMMQDLYLEDILVKKYEDSDVKPYVNTTKIDHIKVELDKQAKAVQELLKKTYDKRLQMLYSLDFLDEKKQLTTKRDLLELQAALRAKVAQGESSELLWKAISVAAGLMKLQYGQELFESQDFAAAHTYFYNFFRSGGDQSKAAQELTIDLNFREAFDNIRKLKENNVLHPKLLKLQELVREEVTKEKDLKVIVFNQYRETAQSIVKELKTIKGINPALFVGQAKKGEVKMSQKEQKKLLEEFREGVHNVLVSTSVGEEGLDIPKVDLVVFYEPIASAIRSIQRLGRTGRFKKGRAYILQTEGTRDIVTRHIANAKEKKMYRVLDELGRDQRTKKSSLSRFMEEKTAERKATIEVERDERIPIYVDSRENNDLIKELYKLDELRVDAKKLDVGDIVVTENIAIERKSKTDFVNSIIDKRLFPQLIDLARNFKRPILILEGEENIYAVRNLNPNVIRATLSAISVDLRIPILNTQSLYETAQMIQTIAKRTKREKKDISLVSEKSGLSEMQELEKFVSSIPKVNVVTAKGLLEHFGSIEKLVKASEKELQETPGVGKVRAEFLYEFFKKKYKDL